MATSIKSLDLGADPYQDMGALASKINGYLDVLSDFKGASGGGVTITNSQIQSRELLLIVNGAGTADQQAVLAAAAQRAQGMGINLNLQVYPGH